MFIFICQQIPKQNMFLAGAAIKNMAVNTSVLNSSNKKYYILGR